VLKNNLRHLFTHSFIYSLGWAASVLAGIVLLPVYSRYLSRADYGAIDLIQQSNGVLKIIFMSGLNIAVTKFFHDAKDDQGRSTAMSGSNIVVTFLGLCSALLCFGFNRELADYVLGGPEYVPVINVGAATLFFDITYMGLCTQYYVAQESLMFVKLNLVKLITGIIANLLFVVWNEMGAVGMLYGNLVSFIPVTIIAASRCYRLYGFSIDAHLLKKMFRYGAPMVPATLLAAIMHNADRFFLRAFGSLDQVGLLTMGINFPSMLNAVLLTSFNSIWASAVMFQLDKQSDADYQARRIATYFMTAYCCLQTVLGVYSTTIMYILVDAKFYPSHSVIPIVCMGYCFHAIYTFLTVSAFTRGKTHLMIYAYAFPVAIKALLSLFFVQRFGYLASAWIICATYATFTASCFVLFRQTVPDRIEHNRLAILFISCSCVLLISSYLPIKGLFIRAAIQSTLLLCLAVFLWQGPYLTDEERSYFRVEMNQVFARMGTLFAK